MTIRRAARRAAHWLSTHPAVLILLVAPYFGEGLSGSTPPLDLVLPWNLALMAALYGCGALLCREVARRFGLGLVGLVLLGAAYGVWEEALVDRYWFYPSFWRTSGIGDYSVVWHTNLLLAVHLTVFHCLVSVTCSVLVVEWCAPASRGRAWVGPVGAVLAVLALASTPILYGELDRHPPVAVLVAAAGLLVGLVLAAFGLGRASARRTPSPRSGGPGRRGIGVIAFLAVLAHWVVVYTVPQTPLPWPAGVALALVPVAVAVLAIVRGARTGPYGADGVRSVSGVLIFFVLLDVVVGLGGRYDLIAGALLAAYAVHRLRQRRIGPPIEPGLAPTPAR